MIAEIPRNKLLLILLVVYFLAGVVGLAYEVLWIRMLSLQFGVSIFGVVLTVAVFMAGLGLGSLYAGRRLVNFRRPLLVYGVLELTVAGLALAIPLIFSQLQPVLELQTESLSLHAWYFLQAMVAVIVLLIPAALMGAGFTFILQTVTAQFQQVAWFYGINAIGATLGALLPLLLLPMLGWMHAVYWIAGLGCVVGGSAVLLARQVPVQLTVGHVNPSVAIRPRVLLLYAGIGAAAIMLEIAWTRLFGMLLLRTEYVVAIILAVFVLGIGSGSLLARYLLDRIWLSLIPLLIAVFAVLSLWWLPIAAGIAEQAKVDNLFQALLLKGALVAALTLPVTLALGAWLPLLTERFQGNTQSATHLYGANSLGSALGAVVAGLLLLPLIGTAATVVVAAGLILCFGLALIQQWRLCWSTPLLLLFAVPVLPLQPVSQLMPLRYPDSRDLSVEEDALSITHVIAKADGQRLLLSDLQRMDASSDPTSVENQKNQARLPLLLHPHPQSVLFLGLGTGITASAALALPELQGTAVELSLGAIHAAQTWFAPVNGDVTQKLRLVNDDVRHFLAANQQRFDVIIGDLFHPDLIGRSSLLSVQQFQRARKRLNPGGIFVQWLALNQFDVASLTIVMRTFQRVFPEGHLFLDGFRLAMVGYQSDLGLNQAISEKPWPDSVLVQLTGAEGLWTWLGRYLGPIPVQLGPVQDEWWPLIEYRLPAARYSGSLDLVKVLDYLLRLRLHVDTAKAKVGVTSEQSAAFEAAYIATELAYRSWLAILQKHDNEGQRLLRLAYQANPQDRWIAFAIADQIYAGIGTLQDDAERRRGLEAVLQVRQDHTDALRALWRLERQSGNAAAAARYQARFSRLSPLEQLE